MFKKIMLCSDGSKYALKAAGVAAEIAHKFDAQLLALSVYDPSILSASYIGVPGGSLATATDFSCYADETLAAIEKATGKILNETQLRYETRREFGHPVDRIVAVAWDEKVDLIVMGSRGLGGFERFLLGSVSDGVLHHAHCPILIVR
jgi:nucleotide-binding universal stress UspA family protein